jgi:hypothetical protein
MADYVPKKPTGSGTIWQWRRAIWDLLFGGKFPIRGDDPVIITWENGFYRVTAKPQRSGGSGGGVQSFQLVSDLGDAYSCYTFDGNTVGTKLIQVAKDQDLRCILPTANPAGGAWAARIERGTNYTYVYNQVMSGMVVVEYTRSKTNVTANETFVEYVTPCLNVGDIIDAVPAIFAGPATLAGVQWLALPGRRFATRLEDLDPSAQ